MTTNRTAAEQLYHMNAIYHEQRNRITAEWDKLSVNTVQTRLHQMGETRREDAIHELALRAMREALAALSPESNTEAAQQNAAELEQAPHPAACICDECLKSANSVWELQHPRTGLLHEVRQRNGYYDAPKTSQPSMFAATNADLPLFSGTAPRAHVSPFVESEVSAERQPRLF